jgi:hypothetical protein
MFVVVYFCEVRTTPPARPIVVVESAEDGATCYPGISSARNASCLACIQPHGDAHKVSGRARTT